MVKKVYRRFAEEPSLHSNRANLDWIKLNRSKLAILAYVDPALCVSREVSGHG
jgi:hypothetical protein